MQNQNKTLTLPKNNNNNESLKSLNRASILPFKANITPKTAKILANGLLLTLGLKVLLAGTLFLIPPSNAEASEKQSLITPIDIIELTNNERKNLGIQPLVQSDVLADAAMKKAQDLLDNDYFAHTTPSGKPFYAWVQEAGYVYKSAGENLAISFSKNEDVVNAWMASTAHKNNLLDLHFNEIGVAVATGMFEDKETTVVVQLFGQPFLGSTFSQTPSTTPPLSAATLGASDTLLVQNATDNGTIIHGINTAVNLMLIIIISFLFIFLMERIFSRKRLANMLPHTA